MGGDAKWLIEAIERRQLIQRMVRNDVTLFEPQAYARIRGGRDAMIGYQVDGGDRYHAAPNRWFVLPLDEEVLEPDTKRQFSAVRIIPPHVEAVIQLMYLQAKGK